MTLLEKFRNLVEIDSPSGEEGEIREFLIREFTKLGCSAETDRTGNLKLTYLGELGLPVRLFSAHMDTVEPGRNIKVKIDNSGLISSDGTTILGADDKDGIAALWHALEKLHTRRYKHSTLEFLFTVGEEKSLFGSSQINPQWLVAKSGWVFDGPGRPGTIYANGVGKIGFVITVHGKAAHAAICPEKGVNAFMLATEALTKFPPGRKGNATVNYGTISGGKANNIVPEQMTITGEIRSSEPTLIEKLPAQITA